MKELKCNKKQMELIQLGDKVIKQVKEYLGDVPLNQRGKDDPTKWINNDKQGLNDFASIWTWRELVRVASDMKRNEEALRRHEDRLNTNQIFDNYNGDNAAHRPKVVAAAIASSGSKNPRGMCQDYASLTYQLLKANLPTEIEVSYIFCPKIIHFFTAIGNFDKKNDPNLVIVDSWYVNGKAILWKDSRHKEKNWGLPIYAKPGTCADKEVTDLAKLLDGVKDRYKTEVDKLLTIPRWVEYLEKTQEKRAKWMQTIDGWKSMQYRMVNPEKEQQEFKYKQE